MDEVITRSYQFLALAMREVMIPMIGGLNIHSCE